MATRWKTFTRNRWTRAIAFVLAVLCSGGAVGLVCGAALLSTKAEGGISMDELLDHNAWVDTVQIHMQSNMGILVNMLYELGGSEQQAAAADTVPVKQVVQTLYDEYYAFEDETSAASAYSSSALGEKTQAKIEAAAKSLLENYNGGVWDQDMQEESADFVSWINQHPEYYRLVRAEAQATRADAWQSCRSQLASFNTELLYYGKLADQKADEAITNAESADAVQNNSLIVLALNADAKTFSFVFNGVGEELVQRIQKNEQTELPNGDIWNYGDELTDEELKAMVQSGDVLLVGITPEAFTEYGDRGSYSTIYGLLGGTAACLLVVLLCCILLVLGAGHRDGEQNVTLHRADKIWSEVQIVFTVGVLTLCAIGAVAWAEKMWSIDPSFLRFCAVPVALACLAAACVLPCLLSQVRRLKTHTFWRGFVCVRLVQWLAEQWKRGPLFMKIISAAILLPLVCMTWVAVPFVIAALLWFGVKFARRLQSVADGAKRIRAGETGTHIEVDGGHELKQLADDLNGISDGLHSAVETAVRSERLKSELISNVSHDLKTPLTGIITYLDLMQRLEPDDPQLRSYLNVAQQKAARLSTLVADLLDASKASSGAMKTELTRVDFRALFQQACGEMQQKLDAAGLDIRFRADGRTDVLADGRLLWRVLDNLLNNCARYALPRSRVYVELTEQGRWCVLTMKNTSAQELNISAAELMERFTRGDRARNTEGSGLGLSIAKSLTELMHGVFTITVDGDLFKAQVFMPLWTGTETEQETQKLPEDFDPEQTQKMR